MSNCLRCRRARRSSSSRTRMLPERLLKAIVVFFPPSGSRSPTSRAPSVPGWPGRVAVAQGPDPPRWDGPKHSSGAQRPTRFPEEPQSLTPHAPSHPQVGFAEGLVGQELLAGAGQHDAAALEDVPAAGEGERVAHVLLHEE